MSSVKNHDPEILQAVKASAERIREYIEGLSKEAFAADTKTQDAVAMRLQDISEQMTKLSERIKIRHTALPWDDIRGLRNRISHGYAKIDHEIIWDVVSGGDLTEIEELVKAELNRQANG